VYYRNNDMSNWELFKSGLPVNVPVRHLRIHDGPTQQWLYAATYGRGIWKTEVVPIILSNLTFTSGTATVSGSQVDFLLEAKNESEFTDCQNVEVGYYLSSNSTIDANDFLIDMETIPYWGPGATINLDPSIDVGYIDPPVPGGTYYIGSFLDPNGNLDETNKNDNSITVSGQITLEVPSQPQNVSASDGTDGFKIVISWEPPSGASGTVWYQVYRNTYNNPNTATVVDTWYSHNSYWDETAEDGIDYYYWIKASYNALGYRPGPFSDYDIGWQYLKPPDNVEASKGVYDDKIKITWDPPLNGTHFKVWRNTTTNYNTADPLSINWTTHDYFYDHNVELEQTLSKLQQLLFWLFGIDRCTCCFSY